MLSYDIEYTRGDVLDTRDVEDLLDITYHIDYGYSMITKYLDKLDSINNNYSMFYDRTNLRRMVGKLDVIIDEIYQSQNDTGYVSPLSYRLIIDFMTILRNEIDNIPALYNKIIHDNYVDKTTIYNLLNFMICEVNDTSCKDLEMFITKNHRNIDGEFFDRINIKVVHITIDVNKLVHITREHITMPSYNLTEESPHFTYPLARTRLTRALFIWSSLG